MRPLLTLIAGCTLALESEPPSGPEPAPTWTISDLWDGAVPDHTRVTLEAVTLSGPSVGDVAFYAQQRGGGLASGLQIQLGDGTADGVPPPGTPIRISGTVVRHPGGPTLFLTDEDDLRVAGPVEEPVATPYADDPLHAWTLVEALDVRITSSVDPAGIASTSLDRVLRPDLGAQTPGFDQTGDLRAIQALADGLLLRGAEDWSGGFDGAASVFATLDEAADLPDGTPVHIVDAVQIAPWSIGERYAVLQDADGNGLWVDTEGWGAPPTAVGDLGTWTGQLASDGEGRVLRLWDPPQIQGAALPVLWPDDPLTAPDGALVEVRLTGLGSQGPRGDRGADDWLLDDRFREVASLVNQQVVQGVVRIDAIETRRLAVLP